MGFVQEDLKSFYKVIPVFIIPEYLPAFYTPDNDMMKNARRV
jgi:hypothetical protein